MTNSVQTESEMAPELCHETAWAAAKPASSKESFMPRPVADSRQFADLIATRDLGRAGEHGQRSPLLMYRGEHLVETPLQVA